MMKDLAEKAGPSLSLYAAGGRGVKGIKDVGVCGSAMDATGLVIRRQRLVGTLRESPESQNCSGIEKKCVRDKNGKLKYSQLQNSRCYARIRGGKKAVKVSSELMDVGLLRPASRALFQAFRPERSGKPASIQCR